MKVCILGLGYVGYPLAELCAQKGFDTYGLDRDSAKVSAIVAGRNPVDGTKVKCSIHASTHDSSFISGAEIIIICVPTPVTFDKLPDLGPVKSACEMVSSALSKGTLVIVESTINPGVMENVVRPLFESKGFTVGEDVFMAHCPERINPGDVKWHVGNIPRVLGAFTEEGLEKAYDFYSAIIDAPIKKMSSIRTAEACKIVENAFRDINIAYVNELAKSFEVLGINVVEVIQGASTKPFAFMAHYPSVGVGGHCIPVDPYYLIEEAKSKGFDHKFLRLAREINNSMPKFTVEKIVEVLNEVQLSVKGTTIGVLGLSYKKGVADLRESPALLVIELLKKKGAKVISYDPYIKGEYTSLEVFQQATQHMVLCTDHDEFARLDFSKIRTFVDGKNLFYNKVLPCVYRGIGA